MKTDLRLSIPKPCSANWDEMTPHEKGKFCGLCNLTVVDFTKMTDAEIKEYFTLHYGKKTCGRFNYTQLNIEENSVKNFWDKKIELVERKYKRTFFRASTLLFLAFISIITGCRKSSSFKPHMIGDVEPETLGEPKFEEVDTIKTTPQQLKGDTIYHIRQGEIRVAPTPKK